MATNLSAFSDTRIESEEGGRGLRVTHTSEESTMPVILGHSAAIHRVLNQVQLVAQTDATVLIYGETGTGKELIVRALHAGSSRRNRPFIKVNCAAMPSELLESELFGHERGAFTGAVFTKEGRFQLADGGTLFLDEIGELPLSLQPKLLRVLQEQEFERVGGTRTLRVNVRIIAATNRDLAQMVSTQDFRADLYYRLNVVPLTMLPLRARQEDISLLVQHFVRKGAERLHRPMPVIAEQTMAALVDYPWPGNVRELENVIERAMILSSGKELVIPLPKPPEGHTPPRPPMLTLAQAERLHILQALEEAQWVVGGPNGAAEKLGLKRTSLSYKMQRLDIVPVRRRRRLAQQGAVVLDTRVESEFDAPISNETGPWVPAGLYKLEQSSCLP
jgi:formate hydrogenlyase transcriptional activator